MIESSLIKASPKMANIHENWEGTGDEALETLQCCCW